MAVTHGGVRLRGRLFAHVETWRPYTACYVGLVGVAGAVLTQPGVARWHAVGAWAVPTLGWIGGLYGGDYFDRALDARAKPHRPIPSGRMGARTAYACFVACVVVGAGLSLLLNWRTLLLVTAALAAGVCYSKVLKGRGLSGNLVRGAMTAIAFLYGSMLASPWPAPRLLPLAAAFWLHDSASNLVGTIRDIEGDEAGGYRTFAVRAGARSAARLAVGLLVGAYTLALCGPLLLGRPWTTGFAAFLLAACASAVWAVAPLTRPAGDPRKPAYHAHEILVLTRILLAGALVVWALGGYATALPLAALLATQSSQRALRERHEFSPEQPPRAVTADDVLDYVRRALAALAEQPGALDGLGDWERRIEIRLSDPDLCLGLLVSGASVTLADRDERDEDPGTPLVITTTGAVFRDIFLLGRSNPRRAYLARRLTMQASTLDMLRLNQLFNRFLATGARPVPAPAPPATPAPPGHATASPRAETASAAAPPPAVVISDTTLRDGEQMPGVVFSPEHKREIAGRLRALGIPLIEAGYPAVSDAERQAIRQVVEDGGDALVQVIARPVDRDLDAALETGAQSIAIFIGTSTSHLNAKLRMTRDEALAAVDRAIRRAKSAGRNVVFAAEDATRTETDALLRFCVGAAEAGADALGLADTVGIATPSTMAAMVAAVADGCPLPIAVHCHNDLGLATANSLAGLAAGASGVQCSVLGIGERAGNAPLEQVVLALHAALGHDTGLDLRLLQPLADRVAQLIGHPIPPYQPVTGGNAFAHESGLHLDGITHDPLTYEPYDPALLGRSRRIVLGKHSGVSAVLAVAHAAGLDLDPERARDLLTEIKNAAGHERPAVPVEASEIVLRLMEAGR